MGEEGEQIAALHSKWLYYTAPPALPFPTRRNKKRTARPARAAHATCGAGERGVAGRSEGPAAVLVLGVFGARPLPGGVGHTHADDLLQALQVEGRKAPARSSRALGAAERWEQQSAGSSRALGAAERWEQQSDMVLNGEVAMQCEAS